MSEVQKHESNLVTPEDIEVMDDQDDATLAKWNCLMNRFGWPKELSDEPNDVDLSSSEWGSSCRRSQVMCFIEARVGHRLILSEWNSERMTEEEFNDFYSGTYEGDEEAKARNDARILKRLNLD